MNKVFLHFLAVSFCAWVHAEPLKSTTIHITCKPTFEFKPNFKIHATDSEGNQHDVFHVWLILDDGKKQFRIPWGLRPISRAPVALNTHETYTFAIKMETKQETQIPKIFRIKKDGKMIYDAQEHRVQLGVGGTHDK